MSKLVEWCVTRIKGSSAEQVCVVRAVSAEAAIKKVIKDYGISDHEEQRRLAAYGGATMQKQVKKFKIRPADRLAFRNFIATTDIDVINDDVREIVEQEWPELVYRLPPKERKPL